MPRGKIKVNTYKRDTIETGVVPTGEISIWYRLTAKVVRFVP